MAAPGIPRHPPEEKPWSNLNLTFSYEPELLEAWVKNAEKNGIPLNAFQADVNKLHESGEWSPFRHAKYMWKADTAAAKEAAELAEKRRREALAKAKEDRKKEAERIRTAEAGAEKARAEEKTRAEQRAKAEEQARPGEDAARGERRQNKVDKRKRQAGRGPSRMTVPQVRWPEQDSSLGDPTSPNAESSKAAKSPLKDSDPVPVDAESLAAEFSKSDIAASTPSSISSSGSKDKGKGKCKGEKDADSLFIPEEPLANYTAPSKLPAWYAKIKPTDRRLKELGKRPASSQTQALKALSSMKGCMDRCEEAGLGVERQTHLFEELRNQVHKAEITLKVDRFIIRRAKMLEPEYGLPRIFNSKIIQYPWDLKMDAWELYSRWRDEIFEIDLLRGIKIAKGKDRSGDSIEASWRGRFSAKYYGQGNLVLGQWWPTQLCTIRDGAHGSAQGGIYGEKGNGAYSIVLSNGSGYGYDDEDDGDNLWYSGTEGKDFTPSENTLRLIETCKEVHNQVRVLRSHQLPKQNPYRPSAGLRYDGLYEVVCMRLVHPEKAAYKFRLVRCKGQYPIRYKKDEKDTTSRPTKWEIMEVLKLQRDGR